MPPLVNRTGVQNVSVMRPATTCPRASHSEKKVETALVSGDAVENLRNGVTPLASDSTGRLGPPLHASQLCVGFPGPALRRVKLKSGNNGVDYINPKGLRKPLDR